MHSAMSHVSQVLFFPCLLGLWTAVACDGPTVGDGDRQARRQAGGVREEPPPRNDSKAILDYLYTKTPPVNDPFSGGAPFR